MGALLVRLVTQELLRAVEGAICLLDGGLHLFDLLIRLLPELLGSLDKLTPTRSSRPRPPSRKPPGAARAEAVLVQVQAPVVRLPVLERRLALLGHGLTPSLRHLLRIR